MNTEQLLSCSLDIGEQMLISGAEVGRVETAIRFICSAYGCRRTDVFTITSSIVVSVEDAQGNHDTQTRRITGTRTDLTRLHRLNALSREICASRPDCAYVRERLQTICSIPSFPLWVESLGSALIAFAFAIFFGGSWEDGLVAGGLGLGLRYLIWLLQKGAMNQIFVNAVSSFFLCLSAFLLVRLGIGQDVNKIIIGNIMLLVPGIAMTNSVRDILVDDTISGVMRFVESVLWAGALASGFMVSMWMFGRC